MTNFKNHDVQSVSLNASPSEVFNFIADPTNLSKWTVAFKEADENSALLVTPRGELAIGLEIKANKQEGTVDWYMKMPDGSMGTAFSRIVEGPDKNAIYSFVLIAPPVPLEEVEGTLSAQVGQLKEELKSLKGIFNG